MRSEEIVNSIVNRIDLGELKPGDKLPTHREMAWTCECSVGTVTRAYSELERRGITYGQVGRGTFIFGTEKDNEEVGRGLFLPTDSHIQAEPGIDIDLSLNSFYHPELGRRYQKAFEMLALHAPQSGYRGYFDGRGRPADREQAVKWMAPLIGQVDAKNVLITQGAQSALYLSIAALTSPGDSMATEAYGYPGIKAAALELGVRIAAIDMDEEGMIPVAFEAAVKRGKIKLLVTVPTNHNPTGTTLTLDRRRDIVRIATENNILILEDGVYGPLQKKHVPTYYEICPDISLYLTSFSKVFSPGLRVGYLVVPDNLVARFATRMTAINWMTSPITLDITNFLLNSKIISDHQRDLLKECDKRYSFAIEELRPWLSESQLTAVTPLSHLFIKLPTQLTAADLVAEARREGISLLAGDRFAMSRKVEDHYVRVCLMGVEKFGDLKQSLRTLSRILSSGHINAFII